MMTIQLINPITKAICLVCLTLLVASLVTGKTVAQPMEAATAFAFDLGGIQVNEPIHPVLRQHRHPLVRPQDEVWAVNTRSIESLPIEPAQLPLSLYRYEAGSNSWIAKDNCALCRVRDKALITLVYVHGNRADPYRAVEQGWEVYRTLVSNSERAQPVRFVIWSWPSTQVRGLSRDLRTKAQRTDVEGYLLGRFICQLPSSHRVSLLGFSYGARVITGAMHIAAGGPLQMRTLPNNLARRSGSVRAVSIAGALHDDWLSVNSYHGQAAFAADRMLLINNHRDPVLKRYWLLFRSDRAKAMGLHGMVGMHPAGGISQVDAARFVGDSHDSRRYFSSPEVMGLVHDYVLWQPVE